MLHKGNQHFSSRYLELLWNSPFQLTSLIYAEKFEFENHAIMEGKQCKQMKRFSVMTKGRYYFLS